MTKRVSAATIEARWEAARGDLQGLRDRWVRFSRALNLTGAKSAAEIDVHMREAVAALVLVETVFGGALNGSVRWLDVGSGGGFPGLVIARLSACHLVMVEPREKRASFLRSSVAWMGRQRAEVVRTRLVGPTWPADCELPDLCPQAGQFDVVGARAVMAPDKWGDLASDWVVDGGLVLFHQQSGTALPAAYDEVAEASEGSWVVRAGRFVGR